MLKENYDKSPHGSITSNKAAVPEQNKVEGSLVDLSVDSGLHEVNGE